MFFDISSLSSSKLSSCHIKSIWYCHSKGCQQDWRYYDDNRFCHHWSKIKDLFLKVYPLFVIIIIFFSYWWTSYNNLKHRTLTSIKVWIVLKQMQLITFKCMDWLFDFIWWLSTSNYLLFIINYCYNISTYLPFLEYLSTIKVFYIFSYDWQQKKNAWKSWNLWCPIDCRPMKTLNEEKKIQLSSKTFGDKIDCDPNNKNLLKNRQTKKLKLFLMLEFNQNNP